MNTKVERGHLKTNESMLSDSIDSTIFNWCAGLRFRPLRPQAVMPQISVKHITCQIFSVFLLLGIASAGDTAENDSDDEDCYRSPADSKDKVSVLSLQLGL